MRKTSIKILIMLFFLCLNANAQIKNSTEDNEYWYYLLSAKSNTENLAIKENTDNKEIFPIIVTPLDKDDHSQQWKFVKDPSTERIYIINRKSGLQILSNSTPYEIYNITLIGLDTLNRGFEIHETDLGQYSFSCIENDNIKRFLGLQKVADEAIVLNEEEIDNTEFAWILQEVDINTSIKNISDDNYTIKIINGKIIVENCNNYRITTLSGIELPKDRQLEKGIYIVTIGTYSQKISIE